MRTRANRIPSALKHGAYVATAVLPGESQAEFDKLHGDLIAELAPSGALEDDIVSTIAHLVWRKQNLRTLRIAKAAQIRCLEIEAEKLYGESDQLRDEVEDQAQKELGDTYELAEVGEAATFDGLTEELDVRERLDAAVARCLKQLLLVRGVKSISATPTSVSPKRALGPPQAA